MKWQRLLKNWISLLHFSNYFIILCNKVFFSAMGFKCKPMSENSVLSMYKRHSFIHWVWKTDMSRIFYLKEYLLFLTGNKWKGQFLWYMWEEFSRMYWPLWLHWSGTSCFPHWLLSDYHYNTTKNMQGKFSFE